MRVEAFAEVVALQHAGQRVFRRQLDHARRAERPQPFVIEANLGFLRVEDLEHLPLVGPRVLVDLFMRQRGPGDLLPGGISDHPGEIADDEDDAMAELLEVLHLADHNRVAEVEVGRGGIESDFDGQRFAARQLGLQIGAIDQIDGAPGQVVQLLVEIHRRGAL